MSEWNCKQKCWALGLLAGILTWLILWSAADWGFIAALFAGLIVTIIIGALLGWLVCQDSTAQSGYGAGGSGVSGSAGTGAAASASGAHAASADAATAESRAADTAAAVEASSDDAAPSPDASGGKAQNDASMAASKAGSASLWKASAALPGQEELARRKGTWRYDGGDTDASTGSKPSASATPAAAENADRAGNDGGGMSDASSEGTRPAALDGPRGGTADDLKQIKGIGPKLEKVCNALGFYHFDQIAAWTADEIAWVDANLEGFRGRVTRDQWVAQAATLAAGGGTEFSKRVEDGGVY